MGKYQIISCHSQDMRKGMMTRWTNKESREERRRYVQERGRGMEHLNK
jgi:hypothetical protein